MRPNKPVEKLTKQQMELFEKYMGMVLNISNNIYDTNKENNIGVVDVDDLIQSGSIGLLHAVRSYDSNYFKNDKEDILSVKNVHEAQYFYRAIYERIEKELIKNSTYVKIPWNAKKALDTKEDKRLQSQKKTVEYYELFRKNTTFVNIDNIGEEEECRDFSEDNDSKFIDSILNNELKDALIEAFNFARLSDDEINILKEYFGIDQEKKTMIEIANERGKTYQAISLKIKSLIKFLKLLSPFTKLKYFL